MLGMLAHVVGFIGMLCVVIAFHQISTGKWLNTSKIYYRVNLLGAILLILSLLVHFNLGSFIIEIFWIFISIKGLLTNGGNAHE